MPDSVTLMEHQQEGVEFLTQNQAGLLAFEQGLGKTLVAIEAFQKVREEGAATLLLVICPNSLKRNWIAELARFAPNLTAEVVEGAPKQRRRAFAMSTADVVVVSYETARAEVTPILALVSRVRTALVLDESHSAKTWQSLTSTAARQVAQRCVFRWLLSGTPVTNSPSDIYTQVEIIAPGKRLLGTMDSFVALAQERPAEARSLIEPVVLRRTKEQCLDLPEKTFVDVHVELPSWQRKLYDDMRNDMVCALQGMSGEEYKSFASTALARLTRLVQIASNPALLFPAVDQTPGKFAALDGILDEILADPKRKVIVWSNFVSTIEALETRYRAFGAATLYGGTPNEERQAIAARFQSGDDIRVLIANPAAAGAGFTLTAASFAVYETLSWRYDYYAQSQDRNHRIGQSLPVTYLRLIAVDTIEEAIVTALERKLEMAGDILGDATASARVASMTREQMIHMIGSNKLPND